jgi:chemotaxis response regulator CheB
MNKIRGFLVDDAAVVRRLVTTAPNRDPDLEVVGTAADGQMALTGLAELQPDGYLLLGGAETTHNLDVDLVPIANEQVSFFRLRNSQDR